MSTDTGTGKSDRDALLEKLRDLYEHGDPVPDGLVERMQMVASAEAMLQETDLDYELLLLVERSTELAGARGTAAYTLRFAHGDIELLVRAAATEESVARLDGWLAPATAMTVRATEVGAAERHWEVAADSRGRFEFRDLPTGLFRLWLVPTDSDVKPFGTPAFEI